MINAWKFSYQEAAFEVANDGNDRNHLTAAATAQRQTQSVRVRRKGEGFPKFIHCLVD
jgi:hypothetical protein